MRADNGDFTPYGYIRNPAHRAVAWAEPEGGNLRSADQSVGMEWVYPWHRGSTSAVGLSLTTRVGDLACHTRSDFAAIGYTSRYHSANILGFDWVADELIVAARFFLASEHALCVRIEVRSEAAVERQLRLGIVGRGWARDEPVDLSMGDGVLTLQAKSGPHAMAVAHQQSSPVPFETTLENEAWAGWPLELDVAPGATVTVLACLGRGPAAEAAVAAARDGLARAEVSFDQLLVEDARFADNCPALVGDWPPGWGEGLIHDLETTRLMVQPAGGIFRDVWPTWMVAYPRVVLAEGALDMLRLAYADDKLAARATLSMFRDAPVPNVPCVFEAGGFNMVARDGSRCGTSPAWCLPFLNLELLYLRTADRDWLAELYPYLSAYLEWWLEHRTDEEGWVVYKCTWEAGEDGSPRLDPTGSGDADISGRVRPVELQASVAHAAQVLVFFAAELGLAADRIRWNRVAAAYRRRTRQLFNVRAGRFCDWLVDEGQFQEPRPDQVYWGTDACRYAPLALTPLLGGIATWEQAAALARELPLHATAPWTSWPSWCYVLLECAAEAGQRELVARIAWQVIDHVYRVTTRRSLDGHARPTPGSAPEFWPADWRTFEGCDAYGWGATTTNLLIRHVVGFKEHRTTQQLVFELSPAFPDNVWRTGRHLGVQSMSYRGTCFDIAYVLQGGYIDVRLDLRGSGRTCTVRVAAQEGKRAHAVYRSRQRTAEHRFQIPRGAACTVQLSSP